MAGKLPRRKVNPTGTLYLIVMKMLLITFLLNKDFIYVVRVKTSKKFSKPQGGFSKTFENVFVPVDFKNIWVQVWCCTGQVPTEFTVVWLCCKRPNGLVWVFLGVFFFYKKKPRKKLKGGWCPGGGGVNPIVVLQQGNVSD